MNIIPSYLTNSPCYKTNKTIKVKGLMLHSVGCAQPNASVFIKTFNKSDANVCVHAFIDGNTGDVYQTLPWDHRGWHCASGKNGSGNNTHIGIEMCEPACITYNGGSTFTVKDEKKAKEIATRTYNVAVELFAMLCKKYALDPMADGVIISHNEGHKRGIASGHVDPEHFWNGLKMPYTMNGFRKDVRDKMNFKMVDEPKKFEPYTVRVSINNLNIRKGPGLEYDKVGYFVEPGVYTIVDVNAGDKSQTNGWGKLKSGAGWISLDWAERT